MRGLGEAKCAVGIWVAVRASALRCGLVEPMLCSNICRNGVGIGELRVQMIEGIEELCPEFEALSFADGKNLKQRDIPVLEAWSPNNVSIGIAKRAQEGVGSKCAGVKQCSRHTRVPVRVT